MIAYTILRTTREADDVRGATRERGGALTQEATNTVVATMMIAMIMSHSVVIATNALRRHDDDLVVVMVTTLVERGVTVEGSDDRLRLMRVCQICDSTTFHDVLHLHVRVHNPASHLPSDTCLQPTLPTTTTPGPLPCLTTRIPTLHIPLHLLV